MSFNQSFYFWVFIVAVFILLTLAFFPLERAWRCLQYPYGLDYAEGYLAVEAWQLAQGVSMYPNHDNYPYLVGNYPPLYPFVNALMFTVFKPSLFWGRLICAISALGIIILMFCAVYKKHSLLLPSLLAPLLLINTYEFYEWIGYARVDLPAIFFSLAGLFVLLDKKGETNKRRMTFAVILFLFSIYTKQIQIFAPIAACLYLIIQNRKIGLKFSGALWGVVLLVFALLAVITRGEYFKHTVIYNANRFDWRQVYVWFRHVLRFYFFYMATLFILAASITYESIKNKKKGGAPDLFNLYALIGALSFLTIGKIGAAGNYILETHAAFGIFFGSALSKAIEGFRTGIKQRFNIALILIAALFINLHSLWLFRIQRILFSRPNPGKTAYAKSEMLMKIVSEHPNPILCEQPIFLLLAKKNVIFQPFIMSELAREGKWDQSQFVNDLENQKFSLIITGQNMLQDGFLWQYTEEMRAAIRANYMEYVESGDALQQASWNAFMRSGIDGIPYYIYIPKKETR